MSKSKSDKKSSKHGMGDREAEAMREHLLHTISFRDFLDSSLEWRRLFSEAWGTFLLITVSVGGGAVFAWSKGAVAQGMVYLTPGLMVMAIIYFMGTVSGAHLNPAVTLAFAVRRNFPWGRVPGYLIAQFIGAMGAVYFVQAIFGNFVAHGATVPAHSIDTTSAVLMEMMLTAGLVSVILGTASGARNIGTNGAIAVGGYIILAHLWAGPVTGTSMNPIRSLAPDIIRGDFNTTWIYIVGPILGAMLGVIAEWILKGKATKFGTLAAQGTLGFEEEEG
jgi:aquaporin Z